MGDEPVHVAVYIDLPGVEFLKGIPHRLSDAVLLLPTGTSYRCTVSTLYISLEEAGREGARRQRQDGQRGSTIHRPLPNAILSTPLNMSAKRQRSAVQDSKKHPKRNRNEDTIEEKKRPFTASESSAPTEALGRRSEHASFRSRQADWLRS